MKIVTCLVALVLIESIIVFRLWRDNRTLRESSTQLEQVRSDLAGRVEAARTHETEVQSLKDQVAKLEEGAARAKSALASGIPAPAERSLSIEEHAQPQPLGLSTNDVDLTSMRVTGNSNVGVLLVPLTGWALQQVRQFHERRQPLVFGKLISEGYYGVWGEYGTNVGFALKLNSKGEAEALAAEMRAQGVE